MLPQPTPARHRVTAHVVRRRRPATKELTPCTTSRSRLQTVRDTPSFTSRMMPPSFTWLGMTLHDSPPCIIHTDSTADSVPGTLRDTTDCNPARPGTQTSAAAPSPTRPNSSAQAQLRTCRVTTMCAAASNASVPTAGSPPWPPVPATRMLNSAVWDMTGPVLTTTVPRGTIGRLCMAYTSHKPSSAPASTMGFAPPGPSSAGCKSTTRYNHHRAACETVVRSLQQQRQWCVGLVAERRGPGITVAHQCPA